MVHVVFEFAEPLLNISPGKPASCSSLARLLAAGMFHVSYMFSHAWPSLQSWSAADTASQVQLCWCHSPPRMDCGAWAWEVQTPRPSQKSTPTCSRRASISWSTTWHRLAAVCWMTCDVCLTCHPDVDCVWPLLLRSCVFCASWTFIRPPDIVACNTRGYQTVIHRLLWLVVLFMNLDVF